MEDIGLQIPPLDDNDYLLFPDHADVTGDVSIDLDFDFTLDDLTFADALLLEQPDSNLNPIIFSSENPNSDDLGENWGKNQAIEETRVFDCSIPEANSSQGSNSGENLGNSCDRHVFSSINDDSDNIVRKVVKIDSDSSSGSGSGSGSISKCVSKSKRNDETRVSKCVLKSKRKKEVVERDNCDEIRVSKVRRSNENENVSVEVITSDENVEFGGDGFSLGGGGDDDEKRKARLMRNRESAQLSRQRKKKYVEELEDKVRLMVSTITDLNGKISYFMSENATLRQQLCGGVGVPPPGGAVNGMMPMPYHWMPCPPPYMVNPSGSSVPLVPIPRLKPQQPMSAPKVKKSSVGKKQKEKGEGEGKKTKKVASVSLIGLLFFMVLFGGLVPMVNVSYGRNGDGVGGVHKGAVFKVDKDKETTRNGHGRFGHGRVLEQSNNSNGGNCSEPLEASLYVPRNEKLIKIDGNLIIHSVLASEKAMASQTTEGRNTSEETSLAIHGSYPPYPTPGPGSNNWRRPHLDRNQNERQRALGSANGFTPIESDGKLQQWFREGLAGPMLSSEMCTEVFQFDVSPTPGSIVPATSAANITSKDRLNSTRPNKTKNRRILHGHAIPLKDHTLNITTKEQVQPHEQNDVLESNKSRSSVVVSVLVDPREIGDGVIGSKSLSRIFVVVLLDSVKYVTYSCMLPFMGSSSHLITT